MVVPHVPLHATSYGTRRPNAGDGKEDPTMAGEWEKREITPIIAYTDRRTGWARFRPSNCYSKTLPSSPPERKLGTRSALQLYKNVELGIEMEPSEERYDKAIRPVHRDGCIHGGNWSLPFRQTRMVLRDSPAG